MQNELIKKAAKPKLVLFDIYETLLSMDLIERRINQMLDSKRGYIIWFELFMQYCLLDNSTGQFHDFSSIADATLRMAHRMLGQVERADEMKVITELMKHLPLQEGVQEGLSEIYEQGYRIAAFTNSPEKIVVERMERTGLISYFETVLSAQHVKKYKPAKEVYDWAADKLQLLPGDILMVSAQGWDIIGAQNAGMTTAYIRQKRQMLYPLASPPNFICDSLSELSQNLRLTYSD